MRFLVPRLGDGEPTHAQSGYRCRRYHGHCFGWRRRLASEGRRAGRRSAAGRALYADPARRLRRSQRGLPARPAPCLRALRAQLLVRSLLSRFEVSAKALAFRMRLGQAKLIRNRRSGQEAKRDRGPARSSDGNALLCWLEFAAHNDDGAGSNPPDLPGALCCMFLQRRRSHSEYRIILQIQFYSTM